MMTEDEQRPTLTDLPDTPDLAVALDSDRFKQFLDDIPFAIAVAALHPQERITCAKLEFECLSAQ